MIDERIDGRFGPSGVGSNQRTQRGKRVEQKMRFDLSLQDRQPQVGRALGELQLLLFSLVPALSFLEIRQQRKATAECEIQAYWRSEVHE